MRKLPPCSSLVVYAYVYVFVSLVVMSNWPPCACLVQAFFISPFLRMYFSLRKSSSDEEMATLLLSSCICLYVCFCVSLVLVRKWPPCSSLLLVAFISPSLYVCIFLCVSLVVTKKWPLCSSLVLST